MLESVQVERTTDSSVGWLNYNKSGRVYAAKCRCMEEKKRRRRGELLIVLLRQTSREEKKEHDREKERKRRE
jgi:hypothetical protein